MIFLYGPPGSGKTATGRILSEGLGLRFLDMDEYVSARAGMSIHEIFNVEGEAGFRQRESEALARALEDRPGVVALGGGALLDPHNRQTVESAGLLICLQASPETLSSRIEASGEGRPLLNGRSGDGLEGLLRARSAHYQSFDITLDSDGRNPDELAWEAQIALGWFHVRGMGTAYDVRVEPGILNRVGDFFSTAGLAGPVGLVSDRTVGELYGPRVEASLASAGYGTARAEFPAGEESKNLGTLNSLWESFLQAGIERGSGIAALGGGVVMDVAGFAAATYMRGVAWVALPTSLLAMVDASLGGKTGIDLPRGKNLAGAFHAPRLVLADPASLETLPEAEIRAGLAEVIKHGVIGDPHLFEMCEGGLEGLSGGLPAIVRRAMAVKIKIIQADPFETGVRAVLNFGHTVGHALESASAYRLRHGEAVAIGMVAEARLGERLGLTEAGLAGRIAAALSAVGLPTEIPGWQDRTTLARSMSVDKKKTGGGLRFALPRKIGDVQAGVEVGGEDLTGLYQGRSG